MKKFLKNITLLGSSALGLLIICNMLYVKLDKSNLNDTKKFNNIPSGIQICNIGTSHGQYSFDYEELPEYTCFNFALSSSRLSYDYRVLLEYESYIADDGIMFIPVSYFTLFGEDETENDDFESKNNRYYDILSPKRIKNYSIKTDIYEHWFPILSAQERIFEVYSGNTYDEMSEIWSKSALDIDLEEDAEKAHYRHFDKYGGELNINEVQALYEIIDFCKRKNIRAIMITTPYTEEYNALVSDEFLEEYHGVLKEAEEYGAEYYDYSSDYRFSTHPELFMNSDHLNHDGAKKFMDILKKEVI